MTAIECALADGDHPLANDLVVANLKRLSAAGHQPSIGHWLDGIPLTALIDEPHGLDAAVDQCGALLFSGRQEWVVRFGPLLDAVRRPRPDLAARLLLYSAIGWATQGWADQWQATLQRALTLRPVGAVEPFDELNDVWQSRLLSLQGLHDDAIEMAGSLVARDRQLVSDCPALSALAGRLEAAGDTTAIDVAARAVGLWSGLGEPALVGMVDALCAIASDARRRGDLERAENLATKALAMTSWQQTHMLTVRATVTLASVEEASGRAAEARTRLENLREHAISLRLAPLVIALIPNTPRAAGVVDHDRGRPVAPGASVVTDRESVILQMLQSHRTFEQIGQELYIAHNTVKTHVTRIYRKLGGTSRAEAIDIARDRGLLP